MSTESAGAVTRTKWKEGRPWVERVELTSVKGVAKHKTPTGVRGTVSVHGTGIVYPCVPATMRLRSRPRFWKCAIAYSRSMCWRGVWSGAVPCRQRSYRHPCSLCRADYSPVSGLSDNVSLLRAASEVDDTCTVRFCHLDMYVNRRKKNYKAMWT